MLILEKVQQCGRSHQLLIEVSCFLGAKIIVLALVSEKNDGRGDRWNFSQTQEYADSRWDDVTLLASASIHFCHCLFS
jgi:hypothetical protein